MNCPNCNNPLQPHQRFCPACGTRVEALTSDAQQAADQWRPQSVQPEPQQAEWRPQEPVWQPQQAQPQQPQAKRPQQPSYQPPQSGQTDRYAAQFQQYQQPSRFANPKHAQGSSVVFPKGKKQKDKK